MDEAGQPTAYVVAENHVTDAEAYGDYARRVLATLLPFGGRVLARAGTTHSLEGAPPDRLVIIGFETAERAKAWWESDEYKAILPLRLGAATGRVYIAEGLPGAGGTP